MKIAATGHRPPKLGGYSPAASLQVYRLAEWYLTEGREDITEAISGMALGWDQAFALAAVNLGIPLCAAVPFRGQSRMWPVQSQKVYESILARASRIVYVTDDSQYAAWKMQKRNEWMINECDRLAALWDGSPGGTANCIRAAGDKPIDHLWSAFADHYLKS